MKRLSGEKNRSKRKGWEQVGYLYKMHQHTQCQIQYLGYLNVWVSGIWVSSGTVSMCWLSVSGSAQGQSQCVGCQYLGQLRDCLNVLVVSIWVSSGAFFYQGQLRGILLIWVKVNMVLNVHRNHEAY